MEVKVHIRLTEDEKKTRMTLKVRGFVVEQTGDWILPFTA